jgi:hypothetical protein
MGAQGMNFYRPLRVAIKNREGGPVRQITKLWKASALVAVFIVGLAIGVVLGFVACQLGMPGFVRP